MKKAILGGALCLLSAACVQVREDLVAVPATDLEALQACIAVQSSGLPARAELLQTLQALRESMDLQAQTLQQQSGYLDTLIQGQGQCASPSDNESGQSGDGQQRTEATPPEYAGKMVVGAVENVLLPEVSIIMPARVDTGATTSSLGARDIQDFERNGDDWVRFSVEDPESGDSLELERRRIRTVRIIQSTDDDGEIRPVVEMRMTLGNLTQISEFTLTDRSHLEQPMLLGRNVLRDIMLVDVSSQNLVPLRLEEDEQTDEAAVEFDEPDGEEVPAAEPDGDGE